MSTNQQLIEEAKTMVYAPVPSSSTNKYTIDIKSSPQKVFQAFIDYVWKKGGGLGDVTLLEQGDEDGIHCLRNPGLGLREVIMKTVRDSRIVYAIPRGMPVHLYRGIVQFDRLGNESTRITWYAEYEPYFLIGTLYVNAIVNYGFPRMLENLKKYVESSTSKL
jgi:hypothetical protein